MLTNQPNSSNPSTFDFICPDNNNIPKIFLSSQTRIGTIIKGTDGKCYQITEKWGFNNSSAPVIAKSGSTTPTNCTDCGNYVTIAVRRNRAACIAGDSINAIYRINGGPWITSPINIFAASSTSYINGGSFTAAYGAVIDVYFPNVRWGIGFNSGDYTSRCSNQFYSFTFTPSSGGIIYLNLPVNDDLYEQCTFTNCIPPYPRPRPWDWEIYDYNEAVFYNVWGEDYGSWNERPFYNIPTRDYTSTESVVWYNDTDGLWTQSSTLAGGTIYSRLSSVDPVYPVSSLASPWVPVSGQRPMIASTPVYPITTDGLVLWYDAGSELSWPSSSTSLFDITNNNNDGTFYTTIYPTIPTYLKPNMGGFSFNGSNQKIVCGNGPTLSSISNTVSVEAWVKPNSLYNFSEIFSKNSNQGFRMRLDSLGRLELIGGKSGGGVDTYASTGTTIANQWVHLVGVWTSTGYYTYINGVSAGYDNTKTLLVQSNTNPLEIGVRTGGSNWFNGTMSIFRVYNRELSASDVASNFNSERNRFFNVESNV